MIKLGRFGLRKHAEIAKYAEISFTKTSKTPPRSVKSFRLLCITLIP